MHLGLDGVEKNLVFLGALLVFRAQERLQRRLFFFADLDQNGLSGQLQVVQQL